MILRTLNTLSYVLTVWPRLMKLKAQLPDCQIHPTGSRYVCSPPVWGTDIDFLVYTPKGVDDMLIEMGYVKTPFCEYHNSSRNVDDFNAWRKDIINLIVTGSIQYAESFQTGTHICKTRNIADKTLRVAVHETMRGNWADFESIFEWDKDLSEYMRQFSGPYRVSLMKAYRAKHGLTL